MKSKEHLKIKAIELRAKEHLTLTEICERLNCSKSTVYYWIKGISIPLTDKQSLQKRKAAQAIKLKYALLRENAYNEWAKNADEMLQNQFIRDIIILYITEGYRKNRNVVQITNSNPIIIKYFKKFLDEHSKKEIKYHLQYHIDQDINKITGFWSEYLNIPNKNIKLTRKSNSGKMDKRQWTSKYGVISIKVGDTYLRSKIQSLIDYLEKSWDKT